MKLRKKKDSFVFIEKCLAYRNKYCDVPCLRPSTHNSHLCKLHRNANRLAISISKQDEEKIEKIYKFTKKKKCKLENIKKNIIARKIVGCHQKSNINYLDKHFSHYLLTGEESWKEIPTSHIIKISNKEYWDIKTLLSIITQQLNFSNMGKPSPKIPHNPYTKQQYPIHIIFLVQNFCENNNIIPHVSLFNYFDFCQKNSSDKICTRNILKHFYDNMRYRTLNNKDSQDNYTGVWNNIDTKYSDFEIIHTEFLDKSPYIYDELNGMQVNPEFTYFKEIMNHSPNEHFDMYDFYSKK